MPSPATSNTSALFTEIQQLQQEGQLEDAADRARSWVALTRQASEDAGRVLPDLVPGLLLLGDIQRDMALVPAAESSYVEALEHALKRGETSALLGEIRTRLATLLDFSQREEEAIPVYEQAILDSEAAIPPQTVIASQLRNNLAMIYKGIGKFALAEKHYLAALDTLEKVDGTPNEAVATLYNNLGSLYYTAGFAEQARDMFLQALSARLALFGNEHAEVAQSYANLGSVYHELSDHTAAIQHYERALKILELQPENESVNYESVALDYIAMLEALGDDRKATSYQKRLKKIIG